ncbi:hypothetical protein BSPWISOXPB_5768 [uncultured Gammaproteobacteria bacterium]|nr:hypothetical protein BSPWISOXPB_5768 [uncultured Gammaproteobacteria bacterium]
MVLLKICVVGSGVFWFSCFFEFGIIERSCQAWNEILSENGFIKNLCSREWSFLV